MKPRSPLDSLQLLAPVSDAEAAAVFPGEQLLDDVTRLPFGRGRRVRREPQRRRPLVLVLALVAAGGLTAAAWAFLGSPARETTSVECVIKGIDTIIPSSSGNPAADCAAEWQREEGTAAPPLRAYDNTHGGVTVLLRSATPPAGFKPIESQDVALIELQSSLDDAVAGLNSSCLDGTTATNLANRKLAQFGFNGWTVSLRSAAAGACYDAEYIEPSSSTVTLISLGAPATADPAIAKLADRLRPITQRCESLPAAEADARTAAEGLTYQVNAVTDNALRCSSVYETVGGTIFLTVRGPRP